MCGIIVAKKKEKGLEKGLEKILHRGPDAQAVVDIGESVFMFSRLAIMGLNEMGMQPFLYDGNVLVCNGEIYNYKAMKKELNHVTLKSQSDCEVLLPLYKEMGVEFFSVLDAEFALVLYDAKKQQIIAGRDPLGIRPLFYGYSKKTKEIIFASEMKAMIEFVDQVFPFPPGHYYIDGTFIQYSKVLEIDAYTTNDIDLVCRTIKDKLEKAVIKRLDSDAEMGFLLSGGLDSSLVCSIAQKYVTKPIKTFSIGMETDPIDLKYARVVADCW